MSPPKAIAIAAEGPLGTELASALTNAGATVERYASPAACASTSDASVVVLDVGPAAAGPALELLRGLAGTTRAVAVLGAPDLAGAVDVMRESDAVAAVIFAADLDTRDLGDVLGRALGTVSSGVAALLGAGVPVHTALVGDYRDKSRCIDEMTTLAAQQGVRQKYRDAIAPCLDEMLMNALYDAPVDEHGKPRFADVAARAEVSLPAEQRAVVQYGCDGERFALSVRDVFGTLQRSTILQYLHKCLHADQQIDRKPSGAGLGLYMMASYATVLYFTVAPGVSTEVMCVFDLRARRLQLRQLGYFSLTRSA